MKLFGRRKYNPNLLDEDIDVDELIDEVVGLRFKVQRCEAIAKAAYEFLDLMRGLDEKGGFKVKMTVDDNDYGELLRQAAWNLESALYGTPAPLPVNLEGTVH